MFNLIYFNSDERNDIQRDVMKKIATKTIKQKVCNSCKLKKTCGDLPGLCMLLSYAQIVTVVIMLSYFLITMDL